YRSLKEKNLSSSTRVALIAPAIGVAALLLSPAAGAVDESAARELARANNCFKCHSISKDKDGPAYQQVAAKYKGKPEAEEKLIHHITSGEKAKFPDGHEEDHKIVKTDPPNDMAQIKNLVDWILAQ
ncbi:MAG: c-type cytochrome, partial [Steroidobacteraceae bacterium]